MPDLERCTSIHQRWAPSIATALHFFTKLKALLSWELRSRFRPSKIGMTVWGETPQICMVKNDVSYIKQTQYISFFGRRHFRTTSHQDSQVIIIQTLTHGVRTCWFLHQHQVISSILQTSWDLIFIHVQSWFSFMTGWWFQPLWKIMELKSVGIMNFPTEWKVIKFHGSKPQTSHSWWTSGAPRPKSTASYRCRRSPPDWSPPWVERAGWKVKTKGWKWWFYMILWWISWNFMDFMEFHGI